MAAVDSGKKKRGGKVFGSLERGLDKMITMLTPSKRRALRDGPRKIKVKTHPTYAADDTVPHKDHTQSIPLFVLLLGAVQRYSDKPNQPRPGPQPDPLNTAREEHRLYAERVNEKQSIPFLISTPSF